MDGELQRKHGALSELPAVRSEPRPLSTEERQQKQAELNALQPEHCRAPLHRQKQTRRDRAQLKRQLKSGLSRRGRAPRPLSAEERQQIQAELDALRPERRRKGQNLARQLKSGLSRGRDPRPLLPEERQQKQAALDALQPERRQTARSARGNLARQLKSRLTLSAEGRQQKQAELNALQPEHCRASLRRQKTFRRANLARQLKSGLTRGRAPRPLSAEERQQKQAELDALQPDGPLCRQARKRRRVDRHESHSDGATRAAIGGRPAAVHAGRP